MLASVVERSARNLPSLSRRELDLGDVVAAVGVGHEGLGAGRGPLDRAADGLGGGGDEGLLGVVEDLRAEAAADVGRDDAELLLGDAEHEGAHQQADDVGVLRGGVEGVLVVGGVVLADGAARLHRVGDQAVVDELERRDVRRGRDRGVDGLAVVLDEAPVEAEVARVVVVDGGGAGLEGGAHVDDGGQLLDVDDDGLGGVAGLGQRLGDDGGDGVADVADLALGEDRVLRLLHRVAGAVVDLPAAGDAAGGGEVLGGEDLEDAGHRRRGAGVDRADAAVRHVRADEGDVGLAVAVEVVGVAALAGEEAHVLAALHAGADPEVLRHVVRPPWTGLVIPRRRASRRARRRRPGWP